MYVWHPLALRWPLCEPFRRMLTHPAVTNRVHWMQGKGSHLSYAGRVVCWQPGQGGQPLHGDVTDFSALQNYSYYTLDAVQGLAKTGSLNVAFQLQPVGPNDGGFVVP